MKNEINKQNSNFLRSKIVKLVVIPFLLVLLWFGFTVSYIIYLDSAFSLISHALPRSVFTQIPSGNLEKGDYISGKFVGQNNNLGILSLRFQTFFRPAYQNEDHLLFQIKEVGSQTWYYQNTYRVGTIYDVPFFPFGFPVISNSKGRTYEFKITSLEGNKSNSVAVSKRWQNITAKYKFTKQEILQNRIESFRFFSEKFISSLETIDVLFSSLVYLLPLFFYLILVSPIEKYLKKQTFYFGMKFGDTKFLRFLLPSYKPPQRYPILFSDIILLGAALLDGFYLQLGNNFVYLLVPFLWILVQRHFRFTSRNTFIVGMSFLLLPVVFLQLGFNQIAENMAVWAFLFLFTGTAQSIMELRSSSEEPFHSNSKLSRNISHPKNKREK